MSTGSPSAWDLFRAEPYRLFFPLGWLWGLIATWHWIAFRVGWTHDYGVQYHGYLQTLGFGGCMATGFLLTALPMFLASAPAATWELAAALLMGVVLGIGALLGELSVTLSAFLLLNLLVLGFVLRRYQRRAGAPPPVTFVVWGLVHGAAGAMLALARPAAFPRLGDRLVEQGFLLSLILGIGSFLGARFMGTFRPPAFLFRSRPGRPPVPPPVAMQKIFLLGGLLLFTSFWIESGVSPLAGKLLRAAVISFQFFAFAGIHRRPQPGTWAAYALWCSYWMLAIGFWLAALVPAYEIAALHVAFIGGFGLMMLVIGLRVVTSHGGLEAWWGSARVLPGILVAGALMAVGHRVAANFLPAKYAAMLAAAAAAWLLVLLAWGIRLLPRVTPSHRPRGP